MSTEQTQTSLHCPKCGHIDRVEKVSSIFSSGLTSGIYSGSSTGVSTPIGQGQVAVTSGYATLSGGSQSLLSSRLAPPQEPIIPGRPYTAIITSICLLCPGLFCLLASEGEFGASAALTGLGIIVVAAFIFGRATKTTKDKRNKATAAMPHWQRAISRWNKLYYCSRDDGVFDPDEREFIPADNLMSYIYR